MSDILHRIVIEASPEDVYKALIDHSKLSAWWTEAQSDGKKGSVARFSFGPNGEHIVDMEITDLVENQKVCWKCIAGPWVETKEFIFDISKDERGSVLEFAHTGWPVPDEFYMHCNSKWGFFLTVSLKGLLESGHGRPHPNEPNI